MHIYPPVPSNFILVIIFIIFTVIKIYIYCSLSILYDTIMSYSYEFLSQKQSTILEIPKCNLIHQTLIQEDKEV